MSLSESMRLQCIDESRAANAEFGGIGNPKLNTHTLKLRFGNAAAQAPRLQVREQVTRIEDVPSRDVALCRCAGPNNAASKFIDCRSRSVPDTSPP